MTFYFRSPRAKFDLSIVSPKQYVPADFKGYIISINGFI